MDKRQFDIVIFGATGMTGKYVFEELARIAKRENIKYALAARNEKRLKSTIEECKKYLQSEGVIIDDIPIIIADNSDENSMLQMCKKTKVLLNCVGPFFLLGEFVIRTCIETGTHYLDIGEEAMFLEKMQLKYHEEAMRKGVYILGACGFGCIIHEVGISLIKNKFQGDVNSIETYREFVYGRQRRHVSFGTFKALWDSFMYGIRNKNKAKEIRQELHTKIYKKVPTFSHPLIQRPSFFKSDAIGKWCSPFPGSDESVAYRTQLFDYNYKNQRPIQIKAYYLMSLGNLFYSLLLCLLAVLISKFQFGKYLFDRFGEHTFTIVYWAEGWKDKLDIEEQHVERPNRHMKVVLTGADAHLVTSLCLIHAGILCLKEGEKMPGSGGVLTPGAAFEDTSLLERLKNSGIQVTIAENS